MGLKVMTAVESKLHHQATVTSLHWKRHYVKALGRAILDSTQYRPSLVIRNGERYENVNEHVRNWKVVMLRPGKAHQWAVLYPSKDPRWKFRVLRNKANRRRYFATAADAIQAADKAARQMLGHSVAKLGKTNEQRIAA